MHLFTSPPSIEIFIGQNGVSRKTTLLLLHATLYLVLGFRHQSNVRKHESNITDGVRKRSNTKWGVRPIDPDNIKGVTIATRAGPFRPLLSKHSGMGTSQPCAMHKTETAALAIQPPGATWRHYNPERGERVLRKTVLARCAPRKAQQPNIADGDGGQRRFDVACRLGADDRQQRHPDFPFFPSC